MREDRFSIDFWIGFFLILGIVVLASIFSGCHESHSYRPAPVDGGPWNYLDHPESWPECWHPDASYPDWQEGESYCED